MSGRRRTAVAVLVVIAALVCVDGVRSARATSPAGNPVVSVSYKGSYHGTINYNEADLGTIVSDVTWDFEWTGTVQELLSPALKVFTVNALTASETVSQHGATCTTSFSLNPSTGSGTPVSKILNAYRDPTDVTKIVVGVQAPLGVNDLISGDPSCAGNGVDGAGASSTSQQQLEVPRPLFDLEVLGSQSQPFDGSWSSSDTISTSTSTFSSSVTFSGGCGPALDDFSPAARKPGKGATQPNVCKPRKTRPNPKAKTTDPKIKKFCQGRTKAPGQAATNPLTCEQWVFLAAFEIARLKDERQKVKEELLAAVLKAPLHFLLPEPVSGPYAGWEAEQLVAKYGEVEDEIRNAYALLAKDPPDPATSSVAIPPPPASYVPRPCPIVHAHGARRALRICAHDRVLFAASVEASRSADAVLEAMITTANRHATAVHSGQSGPAAIQIAVTRILEIELAGMLDAQRRADLRLAHDLGAAALAQTVTQPLRTADLTTPDTTVTPALMLEIVDALATENQLPAPNAAALEQALTALGQAATVSASHQALAAFKAEAGQLQGSARSFLLAAQRELASH